MNRKRIFQIIAVLFVLLVVYRITNKIISGRKVQEERVIPVVAINPKITSIEETLTLTGDIKGEMEVAVKPKTPGN